MFRRKRAASRPPASSAWAPHPGASPDPNASADPRQPAQAPPLPSIDPFGGWPAVSADDPTEAVVGPPTSRFPSPVGGHPDRPVAPGYPTDGLGSQLSAATHPAFGGTGTQVNGSSPAATEPGPQPSAPGHPGSPGQNPAAGSASAPAPPDEWLPLLTHAEDDQRFHSHPDPSPDLSDVTAPDAEHGSPGRARNRRRVNRARRDATASAAAASAAPAAATDAATGAGPDRQPPEDPRLAAMGHGATTWMDPISSPHPMEAAALAGAFAADYLSWDEQAPQRRGEVLAQYLPSDVEGDPALLGWSGKGRQRAEFALPGVVRPDGEGRVVVDVRVRVTPYRAVGQQMSPTPDASADELEVAGVPAAAPAPTARGWKSLDSYWVRLTVPVSRDNGRLVVDTWDEQLGEESTAELADTEAGGAASGTAGEPGSQQPGAAGIDPITAEDLDDVLDEPGQLGPPPDATPKRPGSSRNAARRNERGGAA